LEEKIQKEIRQTTTKMSKKNLAKKACDRELTVDEVNRADKKALEEERDDGYTVLLNASHFGLVDVVKAIVKKNVDVNQRSINTATPIMCAAGENHVEIVRFLLDNGANPQAQQADGNSALHHAAQNGSSIEIIKALTEAGADPKLKNNKGDTPVGLARSKGHTSVATFLEQYDSTPSKSANLLV
jgi:ankyrin repeat protein